jgi:hypothetical protein
VKSSLKALSADGLTRSFSIFDPELTLNSTVIINTHQSNLVVCLVDNRISNTSFEVNCIETIPHPLSGPPTGNTTVLGGGPAEGAILYYTVIQGAIQPLTVPELDVSAQVQNMTAERREGR